MASPRGIPRVGLRFFVRVDVLWPTNDVDTDEATEIEKSGATLSGEVVELQGIDVVSVRFEYRSSEEDEWTETASEIKGDVGAFSEEVDDLASDTEYEVRAVADTDETVERGDVLTFITQNDEESDADPVIDTFDLRTRTTGPWSRGDVIWSVSHENGSSTRWRANSYTARMWSTARRPRSVDRRPLGSTTSGSE